MSKRRSFSRKIEKIPQRKLFVIAAEGAKTERQYFSIFSKSKKYAVCIKFLPKKHRSDPINVLKVMEKYIKEEELRPTDEAWLVVDKDRFLDSPFQKLCDWANSSSNFGFALSNPKFEYWLLLHFEEGKKIKSLKECNERLKKHLPHYDKTIKAQDFTSDMINMAISHAKNRDKPPCNDWPKQIGCTTVYKLVEKIVGG